MRFLALIVSMLLPAVVRAAEPDFTRDIRPILAKHCFKCHGPDDKTRKAKLRLDQREAAIAKGAIVPGKVEQSEIVARLFADDDSKLMPPPSAKNPIPEQQKQLLKAWIAAGAEYKPHWAFVPPVVKELPPVRQVAWARNAIDRFVLARLEAEGLAPSPPADSYALIRRVSLDLIGLPPTPEETEAFVRDSTPGAYERLVDRLLASPHYGERWARRWLDLARYADTNGYEKDRIRSIWPYRDWAIAAINADMPFDRFTIEQLAGDMLPGATVDQRIATGFHRNTMLNEEGGIDPLEFRFHAMTDRVSTTATVWLGLTLGCAQCHSHKYDPVPQREYYQFMAFLDNADEPEMEVVRPDVSARRAELLRQIAARQAALWEKFPRESRDAAFRAWEETESAKAINWSIARPASAKGSLPLLTVMADDSIFASGDQGKRETYDLSFISPPAGASAMRLEVLPDDRLPRRGPGRVSYEGPFGDFFLSEITVMADGRPVKLVGASHSFAAGVNKAASAIDGDPQTGWSISGGQGRAHAAVFRFAEPQTAVRELRVQLLFEKYYAAGLGRFRVSFTNDTRPAEARGLTAEVEQALVTPTENRTAPQWRSLYGHFAETAPELAAERAEIQKLQAQLPAYPMTLVLQERPSENPRATHIHNRGEYLQPTEPVRPAGLSALHPLPASEPANRLTFARWLVDANNPLTGRVTMNRQWAALFGRGIVRTTEDFGIQGEAPSHPELLDWLALEFVRQGWSMKRMHRLMVTSAAYRQSSKVSEELLTKDPGNVFLGRGPRFRLDAELLRDAALKTSGLLSPRIGGPSVFPPQPAGVSSEGAYGPLAWKVSEGADRYRRGLYTFAKRTAPYAAFTTFDGPSGEACLARREISNTPLQALTLMNDAVFVEAARALGREYASLDAPMDRRVASLFQRCLGRPADGEELTQLRRFLEAQRQRFVKKELNASAVTGSGTGDADDSAAWTALARVLLNLDEFVVR